MHTHTRGLRGLSRSVPSGQGASVAHLSGLCKPWGITSRLGKAPLCQQWVENHTSQVELLLKNPPVDAGDVRDEEGRGISLVLYWLRISLQGDTGSIPAPGRSHMPWSN